MASPLELDFTNRCPICLIDEIENPAKTSCDHEFCEPCITEWKKKSNTCPVCRTVISYEIPVYNVPDFEQLLNEARQIMLIRYHIINFDNYTIVNNCYKIY